MKLKKSVKSLLIGMFVLTPLTLFWNQVERLFRNLFVCELPISETQKEIPLSDREKLLISHVRAGIANAQKEISKLSPSALKIKGMSSRKVRHLLNNICSLPDAKYLEIGCWKGSTWIASLYGNGRNITDAVAIDDWSQFGGPKKTFKKNCSQFLGSSLYRTYSVDGFTLDIRSHFQKPVNIYLYDGEHSAASQEKAFTYYNDVLDDVFIAMVDDWNWQSVQDGTRAAFEKLHYQVLYQAALPAQFTGDKKNWWNGFYVAVVRKL